MTAGVVSAIYISGGTFWARQVGHFYSAVYNKLGDVDADELIAAAQVIIDLLSGG